MRIFVALLCMLTLFSCTEKSQFILNGTVKGVKNDKVVLGTYQGRKMVGIDTVDVIGGKFHFEKETLPTSMYALRLLDNEVNLGTILENGNLTLKADLKDAQRGYIQTVELKGSKNQDLVNRFHNMQYEILKHERYANAAEIAAKIKKCKDHDEYAELTKKMNILAPNLEQEVKTAQLSLLQNNVNSFFVLHIFPFIDKVATSAQIKEIFSQLSEESKNNGNVVRVMEDIKAKESIQPGKIAPDFTLKTPDGIDLSLTDLKGQVVLVDFWASWCKPCRASFPHMKDLYKKYHAKGFEILGITNDTNHKAWKKAIKDDGIPWLNVADEFPEKYSTARVISEYGMDYLPSTVLIDREGVIIAKLLHGDELDEKLKEIFGE